MLSDSVVCRLGMPNIDWSTVNISNMSMIDVVDFKTAGAVRLHVWCYPRVPSHRNFVICFSLSTGLLAGAAEPLRENIPIWKFVNNRCARMHAPLCLSRCLCGHHFQTARRRGLQRGELLSLQLRRHVSLDGEPPLQDSACTHGDLMHCMHAHGQSACLPGYTKEVNIAAGLAAGHNLWLPLRVPF